MVAVYNISDQFKSKLFPWNHVKEKEITPNNKLMVIRNKYYICLPEIYAWHPW